MAIAHEFAHVMEFFMLLNKYNLFSRTVITKIENERLLSDMDNVENICKPSMVQCLKKANITYNDNIVHSFIGEFLGSYASSSYSEAFAESLAQVYGNINNQLATDIIEEYKKYRKIYY